jgi:tripartite-type tricarboxylate transporter receptor subunit TctC
LLFDTMFSQMGNVRSGKVKALGITSGVRNPLMPDIPTIAEQGLPGYEIGPWFGLLAPAGTPRKIVEKLNSEVVRIMRSDEVRSQLASQGLTIIASTPEAFDEHIRREIAKWGKVVRESGARAD